MGESPLTGTRISRSSNPGDVAGYEEPGKAEFKDDTSTDMTSTAGTQYVLDGLVLSRFDGIIIPPRMLSQNPVENFQSKTPVSTEELALIYGLDLRDLRKQEQHEKIPRMQHYADLDLSVSDGIKKYLEKKCSQVRGPK